MSNYHLAFLKEAASLVERKKLLLHVCCGPCSVYPLLLLDQYFDVTIYYTNDNIYPEAEYLKRLGELCRYVDSIKKDHNIKIVIPKRNETFIAKTLKYKDAKEGFHRCVMCYGMRMNAAFKYAKKHNFDYCTTVMSISKHKNVNYIHRLGQKLEAVYGIKYLVADFKKGGGIDQNNALNHELDLYHQDYCGCVYSYQKRHQ